MTALIPVAFAFAALTPAEPAQLTAELLAGLPERKAVLNAHGKTQACEGPALVDVLARLGLPQGEKLRGAALAQTIVVRAKDGYEVAFSLGELDPLLGNAPVIVATRCDGQAIAPGEGPFRLIAASDKRPARSVRMASSIRLK